MEALQSSPVRRYRYCDKSRPAAAKTTSSCAATARDTVSDCTSAHDARTAALALAVLAFEIFLDLRTCTTLQYTQHRRHDRRHCHLISHASHPRLLPLFPFHVASEPAGLSPHTDTSLNRSILRSSARIPLKRALHTDHMCTNPFPVRQWRCASRRR